MSLVSETTDISIFYYLTAEEAALYHSQAGANGFGIVEKSTNVEIWTVRDLKWDDVDHTFYNIYSTTNGPTQVFSDDIGLYDKNFRLVYDGTSYHSYDAISEIVEDFRVDMSGMRFRRYPPIQARMDYDSTHHPPPYLIPSNFIYQNFLVAIKMSARLPMLQKVLSAGSTPNSGDKAPRV